MAEAVMSRAFKQREAHRKYRKTRKFSGALRRHHLKKKYGITEAQYATLLSLQNGVCAICRQPETVPWERQGRVKNLAVDHDHKTGEIRGLLCCSCNRAVGYLRDNPLLAQAAAAYLSSDHAHIQLIKELT